MNPTSRDPSPAPLQQPLRDAVTLFTRLQITYALVGGIAAMVYGRARFTDDVDFVAAAEHEKVFAAHPDVMRECHFDPSSTWKLCHDSGVEIDIWKDEHSDGIAARAQTVQFGNQAVRIAEAYDLVAMKLRAHRLQDDYDISEVLKHATVDEALLQSLVTPEQFAHYQTIKARTRP